MSREGLGVVAVAGDFEGVDGTVPSIDGLKPGLTAGDVLELKDRAFFLPVFFRGEFVTLFSLLLALSLAFRLDCSLSTRFLVCQFSSQVAVDEKSTESELSSSCTSLTGAFLRTPVLKAVAGTLLFLSFSS